MPSRGIAVSLAVFHRFPVRPFACLLIAISTLFGFSLFYDMHLYMPWHFRTLKALVMTLEAHSGLWLATLGVRSRWRYLIAVILVPSTVGVYLLLWHRNLFTLIVAATVMSWSLFEVLRSERFDD